MVVVEARVHAAELGQAHRHVAVVEDDRHAEALAQVGGDAAEVGHRHREDDHRVDVRSRSEHLRQVPPPARRHPAPDRLARQPVERATPRGAPRRGAGSGRPSARARPRADRGEALALDVGRVRRRPPPGRLDRPAAVRRHDEVDAHLVQPLPELPPRGRAAVAEVEVDRGRDGEDLAAPSSGRKCTERG